MGLEAFIRGGTDENRRGALTVFGTWDRNVYALKTETGEQVWAFDTGGLLMGSTALDDNTGRVYVGTLGPAGGAYGFEHITGIGREIERSARERNAEAVARGIDGLADFLARVEIV